MSFSPELAEDLLRGLRGLVLRRRSGNAFEITGPVPTWFSELRGATDKPVIGELFPFLETFLPEAEIVWTLPDGRPAQSDFWTEATTGDAEIHLTATAFRGEAGELLLIEPVEKYYWDMRARLQQARELMLEGERRERERHLRELTVHCLVHDLIGNLAISGVIFDRFEKRPDLSEADREQLTVGREAARSVSNHLRDMVDLYADELRAIEHYEIAAEHAPDLLDCVTQELIRLRPACDAKCVRLTAELPEDVAERWPVQGDEGRLRRVIFNLLENALRHTPEKSRLRARVRREERMVMFSIADEGPGVDPEFAERVFDRFTGGKSGGKVGLGLFFVRTTVERWGGTVGHEKNDTGGASFWFRLPLAK